MPSLPALADILLDLKAQLHQLTPNAIAQLSKYFWVIGSIGGVPSRSLFAKRYELHYQLKTIVALEGDRIAQYGCLNFYAKRDGSPKFTLANNNKWVVGWTKSWFYCCVACRQSFGGGKRVYSLHSWMSALDYAVEPEVECSGNDPNDVAFVRVTATIGERDVVKEYVACKMYPLAVGFSFESVPFGTTTVSKVVIPLLQFVVGTSAVEYAGHLLVEVETKAERMLGSFRPREETERVLGSFRPRKGARKRFAVIVSRL
jgi:hypothetical protein